MDWGSTQRKENGDACCIRGRAFWLGQRSAVVSVEKLSALAMGVAGAHLELGNLSQRTELKLHTTLGE